MKKESLTTLRVQLSDTWQERLNNLSLRVVKKEVSNLQYYAQYFKNLPISYTMETYLKKTLVENSIEDEIIKIFQGFSNEEISAVLDYFSKLFKRRYLSEMKRRKKEGNKMQLTMFD